MKFRIAKALILLTILAQLSSCVIHSHKTDRKHYGHAKYRRNGRFW